ncbi:MAG: DNA-processing protein DprA [Patescibacteria group bacterium]|nr:DNA-processing protein DprA [Patescibacteria group bacterium]
MDSAFCQEQKYILGFSCNSQIGSRTMAKILSAFNNPEKAWKASSKELIKHGLEPKIANLIIQTREKVNPDEELMKINKLGINIITIGSKNYPKLLNEIPDPPAILYIKGELSFRDELAIAVVGSRKHTNYGARVCSDIAGELATSGLTIISGLALGIDAISHQVALSAGGRTIGVLGCGLDQIYPVSNRHLAEKIINGRGAIISEFPIGTPPMKYNFPIRNRIIAGLSMGVVVVEANLKSGSLLTSRAAIEYNREVFAIPGSIYSDNSLGPNNLIKMGAKLVNSAQDILEELNLADQVKRVKAREILPDNKEEGILLTILSKSESTHIDKLAKQSKLEMAKINQTLILMEMKGKVRNLGGNLYVRN